MYTSILRRITSSKVVCYRLELKKIKLHRHISINSVQNSERLQKKEQQQSDTSIQDHQSEYDLSEHERLQRKTEPEYNDLLREKNTAYELSEPESIADSQSRLSPVEKQNEFIVSQTHRTDDNSECAKSTINDDIQELPKPKLVDKVKPGVVFRRRPKKDEKPFPNLLTHPVDLRDKPSTHPPTTGDHAHQSKAEEIFAQVSAYGKNEKSFQLAIELHKEQESRRQRGQAQFIYTSLSKMKEFNVHKNLDLYKALLCIYREGDMIAETPWQAMSMYETKNQHCVIDILDQMESLGMNIYRLEN